MTATATARPSPPASAEERRYRDAYRLLRIDPTTALRTLDAFSAISADPAHRGIYQDALALRVIANSMLGLGDSAARAATDLAATGQSSRSSIAVAGWLLGYSGDRARLAAPLTNDGCGRDACGHDPAVELALQAIGEADGLPRRQSAAAEFARIRPDLPAFKLAQAKALRDAGQADDAIGFLASLGEPAMTRAAGILLYAAGRFDGARPYLDGSTALGQAAALGALQAAGIEAGSPLLPILANQPILSAIYLESGGRWREAALAWTTAERPTEAWEAGLMAGSVDPPVRGVSPSLMWRHYALTGLNRPTKAPRSQVHRRYAAIGRTREFVSRVRAGEHPRLTESEEDPFQIEGVLDLVTKGYGEPIVVASRVIAIDPPEHPVTLLPTLMAMPPRADWLGSTERRQAWTDWIAAHPAPQIPGPKVAQYALLAKTLRSHDAPSSEQLAAQLKGLPPTDVVSAGGIALAKEWRLDIDLARSLIEPVTIAACLETARTDLLPVIALLAGASDLPDDLRRVAGEIGGALLALAQARGEASPEAGPQAVAVIEEALSEVAPIADILGPTAAYEHESGWVGGVRSLRAGPILASRAGLDAASSKAQRGPYADLYGPLGRARILATAGRLEPALLSAESTDVDDAERQVAVREIKTLLSIRRAAVGDIDGAVTLAVECKPGGAEAAGRIAAEIIDRVEPTVRDTSIKQLETLHDAYPTVGGVSIALARLLNQRAVTMQRKDAPIQTYLSDMERAAKLDPDSIQIRTNLAQTYFGRGTQKWEQHPDQAMSDLRKAVATDPNSGEIRTTGSRLAYMCASVYMKRRDQHKAKACLEYAVELDPSNHEAFRAAMMLR